jgi:hypothetical protein
MNDLAHFCCQNLACTRYGRRDAGNLSVCGRYAVVRLARAVGGMPTTLMASSWLFPPRTSEIQVDEKWSFVTKNSSLRGYPEMFPCNSRYLNGTAFFKLSCFNNLSIR